MIETNLKFLRGKHSISQAELVESLGIPRTTLSAYERGFVELQHRAYAQNGEIF